jgi:alpha/beta superfamily hydrolase
MRLREIPGPAGRLEVLLDEPVSRDESPRAAVVLAHPHPLYGGTMHTKAVYQTAKALARIDCAVLRFNFRGAGSSDGTFADGVGERDDVRAGLDFMSARYEGARIWAAGVSFGAWVALSAGVADARVSALIAISPPVSRYDFEPVVHSGRAKFFVQGEFDDLCPLSALRAFYARCDEPKELVVIDAADHLFEGKLSQMAEALEDLLRDF